MLLLTRIAIGLILCFLMTSVDARYSTPKGDKHRVLYTAGNSKDGTIILVNGAPPYDSIKLYVTPSFRTLKLDEANKATQKKIESLKAKIEKYKQKNKETYELEEKLSSAESEIIYPKSWDSGEGLLVLMAPRRVSGTRKVFSDSYIYTPDVPARPVGHSMLSENDKIVCKAQSLDLVKMTEEDKEYLDDVYSVDLHSLAFTALIAKYDKGCIADPKYVKETIYFKRKSSDKIFSHTYYSNKKVITALKEDFS